MKSRKRPKPTPKLAAPAAAPSAGMVVLRALNPTTAERRSLSAIRKAVQELQAEEMQILREVMPRAEIAGEELLQWDGERGVFLVTAPAPDAPKAPSSDTARPDAEPSKS